MSPWVIANKILVAFGVEFNLISATWESSEFEKNSKYFLGVLNSKISISSGNAMK